MEILIISLFLSMVGQPYIKGWIRTLLSWITKHPIEYWMTTFIKPVDCFPCFTWWIAILVSITSYSITNQIEYLPAMATYIVAYITSKL